MGGVFISRQKLQKMSMFFPKIGVCVDIVGLGQLMTELFDFCQIYQLRT